MIKKIIQLILILAVAAAGVAYIYSISVPSPTKLSFVTAGAQTHALVIDMDANNKISAATILGDQDVILMLHTGLVATEHQNDVIKSEVVLAQFDENRDGIIDANDSIFSRLELMLFEKTSQGLRVRYVPLTQAGIRAIFIDPKYLSASVRERDDKLRHIAGGAVMADGSTRLMRDVVLDEAYLPRGG